MHRPVLAEASGSIVHRSSAAPLRRPACVCYINNGRPVDVRSTPDVRERDDVEDGPASTNGSDSPSSPSLWGWLQDDLQQPGVPKAVAVEFMAQAIFNFASCSAVCSATELAQGSGLAKVAQVTSFHFFLLYVLVGSTQNISGGHFNPMVSAVMTYMRVIPPARLVMYVCAQILGAITGSFLQFSALSPALQDAAHAGAQLIPPDRTVLQGFMGEAAAAFILIAIVCFTALDPKGDPKKIPLVMGITVPLLVYTVGPVSSMCINPARALGPAVASGVWDHHWIWWTAPFVGAFLACVPYRALLDAEAQESTLEP